MLCLYIQFAGRLPFAVIKLPQLESSHVSPRMSHPHTGEYMSLASLHVFNSVFRSILMAEIAKIQGDENAVVEYVGNSVSTSVLLTS